MNSLIFLFLLWVSFVIHEIKASNYLGKHEINIYSDLPQSLTIHCASKDDDLGMHNLHAGQVFTWHFRNQFFNRTLFFCHFWWGSKDKGIDVFRGTWDKDDYYYKYSYSANVFGIYLSNDENDRKVNMGLVTTWD
ncbi:UNVERIFIED_CONTAM: S-protein5 [Sesamum radiatum]|uniref:S-protein homolog n=1 Tax=Sesamum radiatum TaxID=300843 RepID=A0AAW2U9Y0_SESRA